MEQKTKLGFLKKPVMTGAAAVALGIAAFGAGQVLSPPLLKAQAIEAKAPVAAAALPSFADLVERVSPAVVSIEVTKSIPQPNEDDLEEQLQRIPPEFREFFRNMPKNKEGNGNNEARGGGSGFFISADGYIVTNNHVVSDASKITVTLKDGKELQAKVIGTDERTDIAVIKVEGNNYRYVQFETNTNVRVGDWVVAIGNPFGLGGTATAGIVSALGREDVGGQNIADFIQIDAPINPGNSGGPTFDMQGRVIGINTAIVSGSGGNIGIGFAVPSSTAVRVTQQLMKGGQVAYGWLGVGIGDLSPDLADSYGLSNVKGAIVGSVNSGSPAAKAGLKRGDAIVKFNDQTINGASDLTRRIGTTEVGKTIKLEIIDAAGKKRVANVTIAPRPSEKQLAQLDDKKGDTPKAEATAASGTSLGMTVSALTPTAKQRLRLDNDTAGVLITDIDNKSDAAKKGIIAGMAILEANGQNVANPKDLENAIKDAKRQGKKSIPIYVQTPQGRGAYLAIQIS
jgi:serine protease Do